MKNSCSSKATTKKVKRQATDAKNIFSVTYVIEDLYPKYKYIYIYIFFELYLIN